MSIPQPVWFTSIGVIIGLTVLLCATKGDARKGIANFLLIILTCFAGAFVVAALSGNKMLKSNATVSADQAEMQVRVISCVDWAQKTVQKNAALPLKEHTGKQGSTQRDEAYHNAESRLQDVIKVSPNSYSYQAKLAVMLIADNPEKNKDEIKQLCDKLSAIADGSPGSDNAQLKRFGQNLLIVSEDKNATAQAPAARSEATRVDAKKLAEIRENIAATLPKGWYYDAALMYVYKQAGATKELKQLDDAVGRKYMVVFGKLVGIMIVLVVSALVGAVNIIVQYVLSFTPREPVTDPVGLDLPWKTIYAVFIGWFSAYVATSLIFHYLMGKHTVLTQPLAIAGSTAIGYLLSNISVPLLIYYVALRPRDWPFWESLKMRLRTSTAAPWKLGAAGYLAWCSAIPLIAICGYVATKVFGAQGSDNPVIGQIVQAAGSANPIATAIFYLTLGVMAPFFEELMFRGFLYASLKRKIGTPLAMVVSAAIFASMHFDKGGILMLFAIGMVLVYTFEKTRSLVPSMIAHGMWNSGTFTLTLILFST